jgi:hypothetical protein
MGSVSNSFSGRRLVADWNLPMRMIQACSVETRARACERNALGIHAGEVWQGDQWSLLVMRFVLLANQAS